MKTKQLLLLTSLVSILVFNSFIGCGKEKIEEPPKEEVQVEEEETKDELYTNKSVKNITLEAKGYSGKDATATVVDSKEKEFTEQELEDIMVKTEFEENTRRELALNYSIEGLEFNEAYTQDYKDINTILYCAVDKYLNSTTFSDLECSEYVSPLYGMAVTNVEFGGFNDPKILLAPAIPTAKGLQATKDNILTFGYTDYLKYPSLLNIDRDGYRGVLQMYAGGFTDAICPEDLVGSEYTRLLNAEDSIGKTAEMNALQYVEGSGVASRLDGMSLNNVPSNYGDRFNYVDAMNRFSGTLHSLWRMYYNSSSSITKDGDYAIDNMYSWMAMSAIGHNASPGVFYIADDKNLSTSYYWWPYKSFGGVRQYAHYLGGKSCVDYLRDMAYTNVQESRKGKTLKFILNRKEGCKIAEEFVSKGYIPEDLWTCTSASREEKIAYPIQVMYNYFVLEAIYSGN